MWHSRVFRRLFVTYVVLLLSCILLLAVVINDRAPYPYIRQVLWIVAAVAGIAGLMFVHWLARRITEPIQEVSAATARIAAGSYGHKVYAAGTDELAGLVQSFNDMSERLA